MESLTVTKEVLAAIRNSRRIVFIKREHQEESKILIEIELKKFDSRIKKEYNFPITYKKEHFLKYDIPKKFYDDFYSDDWLFRSVLSHIKLNDQIRMVIKDIEYNDKLTMCEIILIIERKGIQFAYLLRVSPPECIFS